MIATVQNAAGETITATVEGGNVTIEVDGVWAGSGTWDLQIEDCAARLGADDDETEALYDALDAKLTEAIGKAQEAKAADLLDKAERIVDAIDVPDGITLTVSVEDNGDGPFVVVTHTVAHGFEQTQEQWEAIEEAIDLSPLGLEFHAGDGLGGASTEYQSGTYQTWVKLQQS